MAKTRLGIDFGSYAVKFAIGEPGSVKRVVTVPTPDNLVKNGIITSPTAMADFLKEVVRKEKLHVKTCSAVLSPEVSYTKCVRMPLMTVEQLKLNLPFEFRDYIDQGKEKYQYDYAVLAMPKDKSAENAQMELMACAALREDIRRYKEMFRQAGLKLDLLIPEEYTYRNLIGKLFTGFMEDICFIDLGHQKTKIYIYKGTRYDVERRIDYGGEHMDQRLADKYAVDEHIVRGRRHANMDQIQYDEVCVDIYREISLEIMRAINFYSYDSQSSPKKAYLCGGGTRNKALIEEITESLESLGLESRMLSDLLPEAGEAEYFSPAAIGATWQ